MFKSIVVKCCFSGFIHIFKCGDIQNTNFAPDKELDILTYWTPYYVVTYRRYKLIKMVFLAHSVLVC